MCVTWLIHMCDMTHSYVWHDSFIRVAWLIDPRGLATISRLPKNIGLFCRISSLLQGSFAKETYNFKEPTDRSHPKSGGWWPTMAQSYVWHDFFMCVTWLIHVWHDSLVCVTWLSYMCGMTHSYVWHDSFTCVTWLIDMFDMTHSYVWHDLLICVAWLIDMCDMTHSYSITHSVRMYQDIFIQYIL